MAVLLVGSGLVLLSLRLVFPLIQNIFIYHPDAELVGTPADRGMAFDDLRFTADDGAPLHGWYLPAMAPALPVHVLYLHGNAGNVSHFLPRATGLAWRGVPVLLFDYRGFGLSGGRPNEEGTYRDARAAYQLLMDRYGATPESIVVFGWSLGGAVGAQLATELPIRALILESSFTSIRDMAGALVPLLPKWAVHPAYDTLSKVGRITAPTLVIHGEQDETVPVEMGRRLFAALPGPKSAWFIPGAGHSDTAQAGGDAYWRIIVDFIRAPGEAS